MFLPQKYMNGYNKGTYSKEMEKYVDQIFGNKLFSGIPINSSHYGHTSDNSIEDKNTLYNFNQFGYRSDPWDGSHEILVLGCSHTYGKGIPEEGRWTNILQEISNKKVANLSLPGESINFLVSQAFEYFKIFGNPEYVVCFFPDIFRINLPVNNQLVNSKINTIKESNTAVVYVEDHLSIDKKPKYLKKPYYYEDVLPPEIPIFFSMKSIHALEQYCNSNKIKLIWSSWDSTFCNIISNLPQISFTNFFINDSLIIKDSHFDLDCHLEYKERFEYYFDHARDSIDINSRHPGVHKNIHIAEVFYKEIIKRSKEPINAISL